MKRFRFLKAACAGIFIYVLLNVAAGKDSVWAMNQLQKQKREISSHTDSIRKVNDELNLEKKALEKDNDLKDFYESNYQSRDFDELLESESITVFDLRSRKVAGKECCIFVPDGVECTIADSYTASEWEAAEKDYGLVAIPYAGYCEDGYVYIIYGEDLFNYWTATPHTENKGKIWFVHGSIDYIDFSYQGWYSGLPIRLVKVVE